MQQESQSCHMNSKLFYITHKQTYEWVWGYARSQEPRASPHMLKNAAHNNKLPKPLSFHYGKPVFLPWNINTLELIVICNNINGAMTYSQECVDCCTTVITLPMQRNTSESLLLEQPKPNKHMILDSSHYKNSHNQKQVQYWAPHCNIFLKSVSLVRVVLYRHCVIYILCIGYISGRRPWSFFSFLFRTISKIQSYGGSRGTIKHSVMYMKVDTTKYTTCIIYLGLYLFRQPMTDDGRVPGITQTTTV